MADTFKGKLKLSGIFTTFSGMCIGRDKTGTKNSCIARMVVRHPIHLIPFVPGSTLKGAVRRLLEKEKGLSQSVPGDKKTHMDSIARIFGISGKMGTLPPKGLAIFKDSFPTEESLQSLSLRNRKSYLTEIKTYAGMDRITSQGNSYAVEQIPAGVHFNLEVLFSIYEEQDEESFRALMEGLQGLEKSLLGSHGSRGLGQVKFGKWPLDSSYCLQKEMESGLSLQWRAVEYYEKGSGEVHIFQAKEKVGIGDILAQYDRVKAAIK